MLKHYVIEQMRNEHRFVSARLEVFGRRGLTAKRASGPGDPGPQPRRQRVCQAVPAPSGAPNTARGRVSLLWALRNVALATVVPKQPRGPGS